MLAVKITANCIFFDVMRYTNTLTYLHTYLLRGVSKWPVNFTDLFYILWIEVSSAVCSPARADVITSLHCCISYTGCWSIDKWNSKSRVLYTSRTCTDLPACWRLSWLRVWSSPSTVVYLTGSADAQQIWWQKLRCCGTSSVEEFAHESATDD